LLSALIFKNEFLVKSKMTCMVFEGGGVAGIGHLGALEELERAHILQGAHIFGGASAGSLSALLLSLRIPVAEAKTLLFQTNFTQFKDDSRFPLTNAHRLLSRFGWYKGDALEEWIGTHLLQARAGNADLTFADLYEQFGTTLVVVVTDFTAGQPIYMSHRTHPTYPIKRAVRQSCSIPFFFSATPSATATATEHAAADPKSIYVDGGVLDNYPIKKMYEFVENPDDVIGVKLMTTEELHGISKPSRPQNIASYAIDLVMMLRNNLLKSHVDAEDWERTIRVDVGTISTTDFELNQIQKAQLLQAGQVAAQKFLARQKTRQIWQESLVESVESVEPVERVERV